jgi:hypothetical protein
MILGTSQIPVGLESEYQDGRLQTILNNTQDLLLQHIHHKILEVGELQIKKTKKKMNLKS